MWGKVQGEIIIRSPLMFKTRKNTKKKRGLRMAGYKKKVQLAEISKPKKKRPVRASKQTKKGKCDNKHQLTLKTNYIIFNFWWLKLDNKGALSTNDLKVPGPGNYNPDYK